MYRESTKEAMLYSRETAEEDAKVAAAILAEDLKQEDVVASISPSPSPSIPSASSTALASPSVSLAPPISLDYLGYYCLALQQFIGTCNTSKSSLLPICNATT